MKILVLTGSPHKTGTSAALAEQFISGAKEAGHEVFRFDAAFRSVHPCIACERCHTADSGCVFKDDMETLNPKLLEADAIVFVSPIYYYGVSSQLKAVIDRFYANGDALHGPKKAALILTMADDTASSADGIIASFKGTADYLGWEAAGIILGVSCGDKDALRKTDYPKQAYLLGRGM